MIAAPLSLSRRRLVTPAVIILSALLTGCGDDDPGASQEPPPPPAVASVTITAPTTTIQVGQTVQLVATAYDADGEALENRAFDWAPSDPTVATVFAAGLVTGVASGEVQISATSEGITGTIAITIIPAPATAAIIPQ